MTRLRRQTNQAKENHGTPIITSLFSTPSVISGPSVAQTKRALFDHLVGAAKQRES